MNQISACALLFLLPLLFLGACTSAAQRERQEALERAADALVEAHPELPLARGRKVYTAQCATCHQPDGGGTKNAIPPLKRHLPAVLRAPGGRAYLSGLVLYGASGQVEVLGQTYHNQMPSFGPLLADADLAAALAWGAMAWGNDALLRGVPLVAAEDIKAARKVVQRARDTLAKRPPIHYDF